VAGASLGRRSAHGARSPAPSLPKRFDPHPPPSGHTATTKPDRTYLIPAGLALVLVLMAAAFYGAGRYYGGKFEERSSWPSTQGVVVKNSTGTYRHRDTKTGVWENRAYRNFEYTYEVDGRAYSGTEFGYSEGVTVDMDAQYPVGAKVPVFYDPADPSQAALIVGFSISPTPLYLMGIGMLVLCLPFGYAAYRMARARASTPAPTVDQGG
jgi:hypothetical protein